MKRRLLLSALLLFTVTPGHAQQPPIGVPVPPLGSGPWLIDTAEQHRIRVSVVTRGLSHPWAIAFLPDNTLLITERGGRLRYVRNGVLDPQPISGLPAIRTDGNGGLMDVALHPEFERNRLVYFTYTKPVGNGMGAPSLARGRLEGHALVDVKDLLVPDSYAGNSGLNGRVAFGPDGKVYFSTGGRSQDDVANVAQDFKSLRGKVLRLNDDGSVPQDNPFVGREGYRPEIYTVGHRNTLGLIAHPVSGQIWQHENGPNGGDEINILLPGRDYGWPQVSFGRDYSGRRISEHPTRRGDRAAARLLGARHRGRRNGRLHRRQVSGLERKCVRRGSDGGPHPGHRPSAAHRVQRKDGRDAARVPAQGIPAAHPRGPSGT